MAIETVSDQIVMALQRGLFDELKQGFAQMTVFDTIIPDGRLWCDWEFEGWGGPSPEARAAAHAVAHPPVVFEWNEDSP